MTAFRRYLHRLTWLALFAIASLAVLPSVSRALSFAGGNSRWAEVCTPQGARLVAVEGEGEQQPAPAALHLEHCPLCSLSLDAPLLPTAAVVIALPLKSAAPPALYLQAPRPLFAWRSAQPRGPPIIS